MASSPPSSPRSSSSTGYVRTATVVVWIVALGFGLWGLWQVLTAHRTPDVPQADVGADLAAGQGGDVEQLRQRVATLARSDQISRDANRDLQGTLAERDEEIAGLRADVAFYERLVGATGQRRGLTAHSVRMEPQAGGAWHFASTLTQNLNRGAVSAGRLTLSIEGTSNGRLQKLDWSRLRQQANAPGIGYSFKYFQQVEGDVFLPAGVTPVRVTVRLVPQSGAPVEQSFTWAEVAAAPAVAPAATRTP